MSPFITRPVSFNNVAKTPHKGKEETPTFPTPEKAQKEGLSQAEIGSQTEAVLELLVAHNATRPDGMTFGWEAVEESGKAKGCVRAEHAYSGTNCGALTLEVGKSPTAVRWRAQLPTV